MEYFADCGIYVGVSDGDTYNNQAYIYDTDTGEILRSETYQGVNALFDLPVNTAKADSVKLPELSPTSMIRNRTEDIFGYYRRATGGSTALRRKI